MVNVAPTGSFQDFLYRAQELMQEFGAKNKGNYRMGQAYWNALIELHPFLAQDIQNNHPRKDPYYLDNRIGDFLTYVYVNW